MVQEEGIIMTMNRRELNELALFRYWMRNVYDCQVSIERLVLDEHYQRAMLESAVASRHDELSLLALNIGYRHRWGMFDDSGQLRRLQPHLGLNEVSATTAAILKSLEEA